MLSLHFDASAVTISGEDHLTVFKSSDWAERAFCAHCGTHIYYHLLPAQQYIIPAGLVQNEANFVLTNQIYIDNKPAYYDFSNKTENMTEAEVMAQFAPPSD